VLLQCVELDFQYPSEGIHRRWDAGFRITACAATPDQSAFVLSVPRRRPMDETQVRARFQAQVLDFVCILGQRASHVAHGQDTGKHIAYDPDYDDCIIHGLGPKGSLRKGT
jgi:hypothetical protein